MEHRTNGTGWDSLLVEFRMKLKNKEIHFLIPWVLIDRRKLGIQSREWIFCKILDKMLNYQIIFNENFSSV